MPDSIDPVPEFKRGRYLGLIVAAVVVVLGVGVVLALSGVFEKKKTRQQMEQEGYNKEGGCPCQCDRSQAMARELRDLKGAGALDAIQRSLDTIAEREAAGYVTDAMISHRLRLLGVRAELGGDGAFHGDGFHHRAGRQLHPIADGNLRVGMELIVHGQTTEWVNGREKPLRPCFLLVLELENAAAAPRMVKAPEVVTHVPLPVSRWYVKGEAGTPWSGRLAAKERKTVHVIGYVGGDLAPAAKVEATVRFESSTFHATTRARSRWNSVEPSSFRP
jgi:hypothetical protein